MDEQRQVGDFIEQHDLSAPPAFRLLDVVSELGEVAKDLNESTGYGTSPEAVDINEDELGDALFSLLALAESVDMDAGESLETALAKYESRLETQDNPSSGQ
ncbi:MazG nucleotide pyrophosphohydrolase domain-containing protein [Halovenus rubra]|uniref:MazG nucleotide pyrophosphohydrolase domain-containing protein n=2 Tax=Halovenus rubra TaxID=869890 RepID=A0ACC7E4S4_9EURY|nr:MazG nucleotide pyrophosphohydrolase domain-containing protein [Halovenus rubra]